MASKKGKPRDQRKKAYRHKHPTHGRCWVCQKDFKRGQRKPESVAARCDGCGRFCPADTHPPQTHRVGCKYRGDSYGQLVGDAFGNSMMFNGE